MVNGTVLGACQGAREARLEKLHVALLIIGSGMLRRNTELGVRSVELGVCKGNEMNHAESRRARSIGRG